MVQWPHQLDFIGLSEKSWEFMGVHQISYNFLDVIRILDFNPLIFGPRNPGIQVIRCTTSLTSLRALPCLLLINPHVVLCFDDVNSISDQESLFMIRASERISTCFMANLYVLS